MKYSDLTLNQRISLKGMFMTDNNLKTYGIAMMMFGFKQAVEYFLNDDISVFKI